MFEYPVPEHYHNLNISMGIRYTVVICIIVYTNIIFDEEYIIYKYGKQRGQVLTHVEHPFQCSASHFLRHLFSPVDGDYGGNYTEVYKQVA